jgi:uncharacterized OB-fold protein
MSYLPAETPLGTSGPDEAPFWAACQHRELRIQHCAACGLHRHPPGPFCPRCRSGATDWALVPGTGTVFSYTIVHHSAHSALRQAVPYNVAVVMLDGADTVRLVSNVVDVPPEQMAIGLRVQLAWEDAAEGRVLPRFRRQASA